MNILIVNQYGLPAGAPGITRHGDLGVELVKKGHDVSVIASGFDYLTRKVDRSTEKGEMEEHSGVNFFWLKTTSYTQNDGRRIKSMVEFMAKSVMKGLSLEKKQRPDIVFASSPHLLSGLAGFILAFLYRVPFVFEVRDLWPSSLADLGAISESGSTYKILQFLEKFLYQRASRVVTVPPFAYRRMQEVGVSKDKIVHVPNGIVASQSLASAQAALPDSLAQILTAEAERKVIMYTGAHGVANNLVNVLDTWDYLKQNYPEVYNHVAIIFIGGGQERDNLIQSAVERGHSHIYFHPQIQKTQLKKALGQADFLLFHLADAKVFKYGISPHKLYDYLAAAKPILFSSTEEKNVINDVQAGLTFYPDKPESLAETVSKLVEISNDEQTRMGERGYDYVMKYHTWSYLAEKVEIMLKELV